MLYYPLARGAQRPPPGGAATLEDFGPTGAHGRNFRERGVVYGKPLFCQDFRAVHVGTLQYRIMERL